MTSLLHLPSELILLILKDLDYPCLVHLSEVCRSLHLMIADTLLFEYATRRAIAGVDDSPHSTDTMATLLQKLEAHQDAWEHLTWTGQHTFSTAMIRLWELVGGILALHHVGSNAFQCIAIPSQYRGIEYREWYLEEIEFRVEDFTLDPYSDLLVAVSKESVDDGTVFRVHALSLSTGKRHPQSRCGTIEMKTATIDDDWNYDLRIYDWLLAVIFTPELGATELAVWNWQTGAMIACFEHATSFAFLSNTLIMLGCVSSQGAGHVAELVLLDLYEIESEASSFTFRLPTPRAGRDICDVSIFSESPPAFQDIRPGNLDVPFTTSPDDRLFVVDYRFFTPITDEEEAYVVLVPLSVLLRHFRKRQAKEAVIPWEEWGPQGTRLLLATFSATWVCYVHGMKAIFYEERLQSFHLLDFHQPGMRYDLAKGRQREHTEYKNHPSTVGHDTGVFHDCPVTTSLPFRIRTGTLPIKSVEAMMLSEDAIVAVTEGDNPSLTVFSF